MTELSSAAVITAKGAERWRQGHPWIYKADVATAPREPGIVRVTDRRGRFQGHALCSPASQIRLRLLSRQDEAIDLSWWTRTIRAAASRRTGIQATAYRVIHGEGDGLPSLIADRYGAFLVVQLLSAGLESVREDVLAALKEVLEPEGILLRHDASVRRHEGLPLEVVVAHGAVPDSVDVTEYDIRYIAALQSGQKTGSFLDQRENRHLIGGAARSGGRALDLFAYHGSFALHLARRAAQVVAVDQSADALARGHQNAELNGFTNISWREANVFDLLRDLESRDEKFDTIVLDPPAFAKNKDSVSRALAGYKEINLRAMRLLEPGGLLLTCSCSYHVHRAEFLAMIADAARDSGRRLALKTLTGAAADHPEIVNVPETAYLKAALLAAVD